MAQFAQVNCIWGYFIFECVYLCIVYKFIYELSIDHQYKIQYQVGKSDRYLFRFLLDKSKFIESGLILEKQPLILVNGWMQRGRAGESNDYNLLYLNIQYGLCCWIHSMYLTLNSTLQFRPRGIQIRIICVCTFIFICIASYWSMYSRFDKIDRTLIYFQVE